MKHGRGVDLVGKTFGRLTVIAEAPRPTPRHRLWICNCSCGGKTVVRQDHLGGKIQACGCLQRERTGLISRTHGMTETPEYNIWTLMKRRCNVATSQDFPLYGGRGIRVCEAWNGSFEIFYRDMGARPSPLHSIDRMNTNGNYEPGNCRWATPKEQANNRRDTGYTRWNPRPR